MNIHTQILNLVEACHRAARYDLIRYSSGNFSCRLDHERFAITGRGTWLGHLTTSDIVTCRLADGSSLDSRSPSVESRFHAGILRCRPEMEVVLHFQSPAATAIACTDPSLWNFMIIPEIPFYIGSIAWIAYDNPGSPELAEAVIHAAATHNMVLLRNHGLVTVGKSFDDALQKAGFFELACSILLQSGGKATPIPPAGIEALHQRAAAEKSA